LIANWADLKKLAREHATEAAVEQSITEVKEPEVALV
jgi:hypothetical protein